MSEEPTSPEPPEFVRKLSGGIATAWTSVALLGMMLVCFIASSTAWERSTFTPLQRAAVDGDVKECERLVKSGIAVDVPDDRGVSALGYAIDRQQVDVVRKLIELGARVNKRDNDNRTPLIFTARPPYGKGGYSALSRDVRNEIAKILIRHGADVNQADTNGNTALHGAVADHNAGLVRILLAAGADATKENAFRDTPVSLAKLRGYENDEVGAALRQGAK